MKVLKGILKDSLAYYERLERGLIRRLGKLPKGSVKRRQIKGRAYYYLQRREGSKVLHQYLGRKKPEALIKAVQERHELRGELGKVRAALALLPKRKLQA
jgi:hypothetical protein